MTVSLRKQTPDDWLLDLFEQLVPHRCAGRRFAELYIRPMFQVLQDHPHAECPEGGCLSSDSASWPTPDLADSMREEAA